MDAQQQPTQQEDEGALLFNQQQQIRVLQEEIARLQRLRHEEQPPPIPTAQSSSSSNFNNGSQQAVDPNQQVFNTLISQRIPFSSLPSFSGTVEEDVDDWMDQLADFATILQWDRRSAAVTIRLLLKGAAAGWSRQLPPDVLNNPDQFFYQLRQAFSRYPTPQSLYEAVHACKQLKEEAFTKFEHRLGRLIRRAYGERLDEQDRIQHLINGALPEISCALIEHTRPQSTYAEAVAHARRREQAIHLITGKVTPQEAIRSLAQITTLTSIPQNRVEGLWSYPPTSSASSVTSESAQVSALTSFSGSSSSSASANNRSKRFDTCNYCGKKGHWSSECRSRQRDLSQGNRGRVTSPRGNNNNNNGNRTSRRSSSLPPDSASNNDEHRTAQRQRSGRNRAMDVTMKT